MAKIDWGTTAGVALPLATTVIQKHFGKDEDSASPKSFSRGGKVRKTGYAKVHKGERVLTKKQARKYDSSKR